MIRQKEVIQYLIIAKDTVDASGRMKIDYVISLLENQQKNIEDGWQKVPLSIADLVDSFNETIQHLDVRLCMDYFEANACISVTIRSVVDTYANYSFGVFRLSKREDKMVLTSFNSEKSILSLTVLKKEISGLFEKNRAKCENIHQAFSKN